MPKTMKFSLQALDMKFSTLNDIFIDSTANSTETNISYEHSALPENVH